MPTFGERFKELRLYHHLTQQELVDKVNDKYNLTFGKSAISQYENDKRIPEIAALEKFADFFCVSIDYLLGKSKIKKAEDYIKKDSKHYISTEGLDDKDVQMIKDMVDRLKQYKSEE